MIRKGVIQKMFAGLEAQLLLLGSRPEWPRPGIFRVLPDGSQETIAEPVRASMSAVEVWLPEMEKK